MTVYIVTSSCGRSGRLGIVQHVLGPCGPCDPGCGLHGFQVQLGGAFKCTSTLTWMRRRACCATNPMLKLPQLILDEYHLA